MTQKHLSYYAILVLAANTMNGPGITTLPDVAVDAGLTLYIVLIAISVRMASFVCTRMVFAMWSSLKGHAYYLGKEGYDRCSSVDDGIKTLVVEEEEGRAGDDFRDAAACIQLAALHPNQQLEHRAFVESNHDPQSKNFMEQGVESENETESLLDHGHKIDEIHVQPVLEHSSIVGQTLEGYGRSMSTAAALTMVASALCLALAQMMLCAAIMDGLFVVVGGKSCALGLLFANADGEGSFVYCTTIPSMKPYMNSGAPVSLISIGWVIAAAVSVFLGTKHLDEMMTVQYTFFGCLLVACVRFAFVLRSMATEFEHDSSQQPESENAEFSPLSRGIGRDPFSTIGPIMFNFAFVVTAPPLSALAKRQSIASDALGMSCVVMGILYAIIGWVGAPVSNAVHNGLIPGGGDTNLLSLVLLSGINAGVSTLDLVCLSAFGVSILASIPVYCLLAQQTLEHNADVPKIPAFVLCNVVPWILVALTYNAAFFEAFVNWSGLLILGYANFSLPLLLDSRLQKVRRFMSLQGDGDSTRRITNVIFSLVTASISAVIAISLMPSPSLMVTGVVFITIMVLTMLWPDASMEFHT